MGRTRILASLTLTLVAGTFAGRARAQQPERLWISTESALLSKPSDISLSQDGTVFVLDAMDASVLVLSGPAELKLRVGREGRGPGEFREPSELDLLANGFEVLDRGNDRIQRFSYDGEYLASRPLPPFGAIYPVALSNGRIAVNTLGDTTLIATYDSLGTLASRFAEPAAIMPRGISMSAVRKDVLSGKIPGFFRNTVQPYFAPDGSLWLAWMTDARLERRTSTGEVEATFQLNEPELAGIRERFFERYEDPHLRGLPSLVFIADVYPTSSGAWVLLKADDDDPAVVVHVSPDGQKLGRWAFSDARGATHLAVDEAKKAIYLVLGPTAELVQFALGRPSG